MIAEAAMREDQRRSFAVGFVVEFGSIELSKGIDDAPALRGNPAGRASSHVRSSDFAGVGFCANLAAYTLRKFLTNQSVQGEPCTGRIYRQSPMHTPVDSHVKLTAVITSRRGSWNLFTMFAIGLLSEVPGNLQFVQSFFRSGPNAEMFGISAI